MKVLIFSDTHGDSASMSAVIRSITPDMVIHLGDNVSDIIKIRGNYPEIKFEYIAGNTDYASTADREKLLRIEALNVFITHGDEYGVKESKAELSSASVEKNADIVLYGHTHIPCISLNNGIAMICPGRSGINPRKPDRINATFGVMDICGKNFDCEILLVYNQMASLSTL